MLTEIGLRNLQNNSKVITGFQHCSKIKTSESYKSDANNVGDSWPDGYMDNILDSNTDIKTTKVSISNSDT
jgi:hypothetical protein